MNILDKFTTNLKNVLTRSYELSRKLGHSEINLEHIFYCLLTQKGGIGAEILHKMKLKPEYFRPFLMPKKISKTALVDQPIKLTTPVFSSNAKRSLEKTVLVANLYNHKYVGTEHLLSGLLQIISESPNFLNKIFTTHKIDFKHLDRHLDTVLKSTSKFPDFLEFFVPLKEREELDDLSYHENQNNSLNLFATELTNEKIQKNIDPVIGRETEITRLIQILTRRTKNNPVLLGEAGVGKTAIVEGLAKKIINEEVPDILINKKIWTLDLGLLVAGTMFRGEFEARLKQIIEEIKNDPDIILFIDELHTIVGAGASPGSLDVANILKPYLARGQIRCIGATTLDEFKKHIEGDPALERRFQAIIADEPSPEKSIEILKGIKKNYENYHQIAITSQAIQAAVSLSDRYLTEKFLPDKAIDLIDEAASGIKIKLKKNTPNREIKNMGKTLEKIREEKQKAVIEENFKKALAHKTQEKQILIKLSELRKKQNNENRKILGKITKKEIAEIVSRITGVPLKELISEEKEKLLNLEKTLSQKIIGQDKAISIISEFLRRSKTGLTASSRPLGSYIFAGPTGVGKTELAKVIAETLFENKRALIKIDMSEFAESFNVSRLIGSPAGYVGYKEGGKLTEAVRRQPYAVVLFDEIEKAHPEIFNLLLQVLEDGYLTDASGKKVNFKNTIIIMTSNIGGEYIAEKNLTIGFGDNKQETKNYYQEIENHIKKELKNHFRPEFLNRLDKVLVFKPLDFQNIRDIIVLKLNELKERLEEQKIKLSFKDGVVKFLAKKSFSHEEGARAIRRVIQELIENPLAKNLLKNKFVPGDSIVLETKKNKFIFKKE